MTRVCNVNICKKKKLNRSDMSRHCEVYVYPQIVQTTAEMWSETNKRGKT